MAYMLRILEPAWQRLQQALWERSDVESGALLLAEQGGDADHAWFAVREVIPIPEAGYRQRRADFMEIDPIWMNSQCAQARRARLSVFTVHTHLTDAPAWFSWADDQGDSRLMPALLHQMPENLHGSLNVTTSDATARVFRDGTFKPARISVVGAGLVHYPVPHIGLQKSHSRQALALGGDGQEKVAALRVGVVGLGGTGSVVSVLLARLGVRDVVLVDGDHIEDTNLSRILGSSPDDVAADQLKTSVARREFSCLDTAANVESVPDMLSDESGLAALTDCDVIFSCVDKLLPRAVLNRFAYASLVPVIDMGSAFRVDDSGKIVSQGGKVVIIGPGRPCLWCWGDLDAERIRVEGLPPEERLAEARDGYITGADEPQPSVITFNASLAAAAVTEMLRMVTEFASAETPTQRLNFNFALGTVTRARRAPNSSCRFCGGWSG